MPIVNKEGILFSKFRKTLQCIFLFSIFINAAAAQSLTLNGVVQDVHTKEPIPFASLKFKNSGIGKTADSAGRFTFYISNFSTDTLMISNVGYQPLYIIVADTAAGKSIVINLQRGVLNTGYRKNKV
jgi:hypothetical protein